MGREVDCLFFPPATAPLWRIVQFVVLKGIVAPANAWSTPGSRRTVA
jgi:hypothetical protein